MAKKPRQIEPYSLVEVSCRTIGSRYLLKPSKEANHLIAGVLARAARLNPVEVIIFVAMPNHVHGIIAVGAPLVGALPGVKPSELTMWQRGRARDPPLHPR